jgi:hypothetical protein
MDLLTPKLDLSNRYYVRGYKLLKTHFKVSYPLGYLLETALERPYSAGAQSQTKASKGSTQRNANETSLACKAMEARKYTQAATCPGPGRQHGGDRVIDGIYAWLALAAGPCLVPQFSSKIYYAKRRFLVITKYRQMHGVLNVDEIKN